MVFLVTVPMVRDCCLPVTHRLPCHETQHRDDVTCFSNQQAITETKTALGLSPSLDYHCLIADHAKFAIATQIRRASDTVTLVPIPRVDIYLRTGALLI